MTSRVSFLGFFITGYQLLRLSIFLLSVIHLSTGSHSIFIYRLSFICRRSPLYFSYVPPSASRKAPPPIQENRKRLRKSLKTGRLRKRFRSISLCVTNKQKHEQSRDKPFLFITLGLFSGSINFVIILIPILKFRQKPYYQYQPDTFTFSNRHGQQSRTYSFNQGRGCSENICPY